MSTNTIIMVCFSFNITDSRGDGLVKLALNEMREHNRKRQCDDEYPTINYESKLKIVRQKGNTNNSETNITDNMPDKVEENVVPGCLFWKTMKRK